jgi:hypothetical protein
VGAKWLAARQTVPIAVRGVTLLFYIGPSMDRPRAKARWPADFHRQASRAFVDRRNVPVFGNLENLGKAPMADL